MDRPSLYARIARASLAHPRRAAWLAALVAALSALVALPPEVDSDLIHLLPQEEPSVAAIRRLHEEGVGVNFLMLSFGSDDPVALDRYLDDLVAELQRMDGVALAVHEVDADVARQVGLLQLRPDDVDTLTQRLRGALALGPALNPLVTQRLMDMGEVTQRIAEANEAAIFRATPGREKVLVQPSGSAGDATFVVPFMNDVQALLERSEPAAHGVQLLWMGGAYRHTWEDLVGIQRDLVVTSVASAVLVLAAILLAFRSVKAVAIVSPPLLLANLINLALVPVLLGRLNTFTSLGTAILFGLGIDFAIHLVGRYRELRHEGLGVDDAICVAWDRTGPPCLIAALTTSAGFAALALARFQGFAQLGVLLAVGVLVCLATMLVLLPPLLARLDADPVLLLGTRGASGVAAPRRYPAAPVGLGLALLATLLVGALGLPRLGFEYDMSALRRDGQAYAELTELERELARDAYSPIVVGFDTPDAVLAGEEAVRQAMRAGRAPHVAGVVSARDMLPPDQELRNARLRELIAAAGHRNLRYLPPQLAAQLAGLRGATIRTLTPDDIPQPIRDLFAVDDPDTERMLLLPKGNMYDVREARALEQELQAVLPGREAAGEYLGLAAMFLLALDDVPRFSAGAFLLVLLIAAWDVRRPLHVLAVMASLATGVIWAAAALALLGVKLTMVNLTGLPILLGIGVDVVVHLAHRLREEGPGGVRRALTTTGVAAGLSTLTTVLSFFALTFASHRGVRSLGELVVVGLTVVFVVSGASLTVAWTAGWQLGARPAARDEVARAA